MCWQGPRQRPQAIPAGNSGELPELLRTSALRHSRTHGYLGVRLRQDGGREPGGTASE